MFRYLYDFTYECDIDEAVVFFCFYYIVNLYILISCGLIIYYVLLGGNFYITFHNGYKAGFGLIMLLCLLGNIFVPTIFCSIFTIIILVRKKINTLDVILPSVFILFLTCFVPDIHAILIGLVPPMLIMQMESHALDKKGRELEKENLAQQIRVEKLLHIEQVMNKGIEKNKDN